MKHALDLSLRALAQVVEALRSVAKRLGRTVISTIHQPRLSALQCFDRVMLLAEGRLVYFGPTAPRCLAFFEQAGFRCPPYENVADWMLVSPLCLTLSVFMYCLLSVCVPLSQSPRPVFIALCARDQDLVNTASAAESGGPSASGSTDNSPRHRRLAPSGAAAAVSGVGSEQQQADEVDAALVPARAATAVSHVELAAAAETGAADAVAATTAAPSLVDAETATSPPSPPALAVGGGRAGVVQHLAACYARSEWHRDAMALPGAAAAVAATERQQQLLLDEAERGGDRGAQGARPRAALLADSGRRSSALQASGGGSGGGSALAQKDAEALYATTFTRQLWVLLSRSFYHKLREPIAVMTQAFNATVARA